MSSFPKKKIYTPGISAASMVDKSRGRVRVLSYAEAGRVRREQLELSQEQFARYAGSEFVVYAYEILHIETATEVTWLRLGSHDKDKCHPFCTV